MKIPRSLAALACLATAAFWVACVGIPIASVLVRAWKGGAHGSALLDPWVLATARATILQAIASASLAALLGLPLGLFAGTLGGRPAAWADALLLAPASVPTVVAAAAWIGWLGRSGWLASFSPRGGDWAYSLKAVILAHVFYNVPWIAAIVAAARRSLPPARLETAASLGAGRLKRFLFVIWPHVRPAFASASSQALAFCAMSFALVMILGGGPPVETLETAIYARLRFGTLDLEGAAACAFWEMAIVSVPMIFMVLALGGERKAGLRSTGGAALAHEARSRPGSAWVCAACAAFVVPYGIVFFGEGASWFQPAFWAEIRHPLALSLAIALLSGTATLLAACGSLLALAALPGGTRGGGKIRAAASALLSIPSGVSVLVLGLGSWLAYGRWIDPFEGSLAAIVLLQMTVFFPTAFRMLWPVAQSAQRSRLEAAATLGASPWRAFRWVEWPRWKGPVLSAGALVSAAALGEVAAVSLFYSENLIPLPLLASRWMGQYRFEDARAVSALLLVGAAGIAAAGAWAGKSGIVARKESLHD